MMAIPQLRSSQIITTYGPGSLVDLPDDSVIISGLDDWKYSKNAPLPTVSEPRLQRKLEHLLSRPSITLRKPPPAHEDKGFTPNIGAFRFPEWYIVQHQITTPSGHRSRRIVKFQDLERRKFRDSDDGKTYSVVPVRFVRACPRGHVGDIDWHAFVHGQGHNCRRELSMEERGTSGDLDAVWIRCACGQERVMSQAARSELQALGQCNGSRPWLGNGTNEKCGLPNRLLIRSATNAYFPQTLSVISIPDTQDAIDSVVQSIWAEALCTVQTVEQLEWVRSMPAYKERLEGFKSTQLMEAICRCREGGQADDRPVKDAEFDALTDSAEELGTDKPEGDFYARMLPETEWQCSAMELVERVVLVHRLREVVAQVGFTRFEAAGPDTQGELDLNVQSATLARDAEWLPANENRGEGIFIQLKASAIESWLESPSAKERNQMLVEGFALWRAEHENTKINYPGLPYYLLHSLSHLLMTSIALECGYPASSLRERIYSSPGRNAILIFTGSSDAEGTLGGLVQEGRSIKRHFANSLELGRLCSNDPVCALHRPSRHDNQPLLGSACHGCLLISETSCEQHNDYLDRALVVATVENLGTEFFRS